jgi:hypothetical protein
MRKITITREVSEHELDSLHDAVYEATEQSLNHDELVELFYKLPDHLQSEGLAWGFSDTCWRDNVYEFLQKSV